MRVARRLPKLRPRDFELPTLKDARSSGLKYGLTLDDIRTPPNYDDIRMPDKKKLPGIPRVPADSKLHKKNFKTLSDIIGVEEDAEKNSMVYDQWAIVALNGGYLKYEHFEFMRVHINRQIQHDMFAEYRVPGPWKAITKKNQGTRMGGGKSEISYYVTPVKKFAVLMEVGGKCEYVSVKKWLEGITSVLPMRAAVVTPAQLESMKHAYFEEDDDPGHPFTIKNIVDYNLGGLRTRCFGPLQIKHYLEFS
jgi:large subunit ribosomal protein L16